MAKINLDKYYTEPSVAKYCIDKTNEFFPDISEYLEPSAGNGSFSLQLLNCLAYDIAPEHSTILKQDFLTLNIPYKSKRCIIGNPPFGTRNTLSVKFFKKAIQLGDYISFIQPISQFKNNQQLYEFDLIHSEELPLLYYSGVKLHCAFNLYKRPENGFNISPINYKLHDISIKEYRRNGSYPKPAIWDYAMCGWGNLNNTPNYPGEYAQELYIQIHNVNLKEKIMEVLARTDWNSLYPCISTPKIQAWKIYKYLKEQIPELY